MLKTLFDRLSALSFAAIARQEQIHLYAGDVPNLPEYAGKGLVGLSLTASDSRHIRHDITKPYPLADGTVDSYQAEDVFEHIEYDKLVDVVDEIHRVLKPSGWFRLSVPDYRCDILRNRSLYNVAGEIAFDPIGGGAFRDGQVVDGGHVWFPTYEKVKRLIERSKFDDFKFYHYYDENGKSVTNEIDYSKGYVMRTPDHDARVQNPYRAMSIVVDMFKK